jgi:MFS family permease
MNPTADAPKTSLSDDLIALAKSRRELWLVYLATLLEYIGVYSFLVTLPLWLSGDFGMTDQEAGWWAATFSTLLTLFVFVVGSIADAVGIRRTLIVSFGFAAVIRLAMSLAPTRTTAVAALLLYAFAFATTGPVLQTAVHRAATKRTRAFGFSLWYVSFNLGGVFSGLLLDGVRARFLDPETKKLVTHVVDLPLLGPRPMSAHAAVLGAGFVTALIAAFVLLFVRSDFDQARDPDDALEQKKVNPFQALREAFLDRAFWRFLLLLALLCLVRMMFQHMHFTWPKYVTREQGEAFPVGKVWGLNALLILGLAPLGTAITRGRRPFNVLLFGAFISALSPFVLCLGSTLPFQLGMVLTLTIGEALWSPRVYEYNLSIAPRGREATYVSLAALPYFLAKFLVGPTSGYLLNAYVPAEGPRRPAIMWAIIGLLTMIGPIGIFLGRGWLDAKEKAAEPESAPA